MVTALVSTAPLVLSARPVSPSHIQGHPMLVRRLTRSLYRTAACLVRTVGEEQPLRRAAVSAHIAMIVDLLLRHHVDERHVEVRLGALIEALAAWDARGGADDGTVTGMLEELRAMLDGRYGGDRETQPFIARRETAVGHWQRFSHVARTATPAVGRSVQLGYLLETLPVSQRDLWMQLNLPWSTQLAWVVYGERRFLRYRRRLAVDG